VSRPPARKGTQTRPEDQPGPAPGDAHLTRDDVAPRRRGNWIAWVVPGLILLFVVVGTWVLLQPRLTVVDEPEVILRDDDAATGGDLGG
jgi:hypothetical protein